MSKESISLRHLATHISSHKRIVREIARDPQIAAYYLEGLKKLVPLKKEPVDYVVVLGTSPLSFPSKFIDRIDTAVGLVASGLSDRIVFTGSVDDEAKHGDVYQSHWAKDYAVKNGFSPEKCDTVGGTSTTGNIKEFLNLIAERHNNEREIVFGMVTQPAHCLRTVVNIHHIIPSCVRVRCVSYPVGGKFPTKEEADDPGVRKEVAKAVAEWAYTELRSEFKDWASVVGRKMRRIVKLVENELDAIEENQKNNSRNILNAVPISFEKSKREGRKIKLKERVSL